MSAFSDGFSIGFGATPIGAEPGWMQASIQAFIDWHPTYATITRRTRQASAAGGWIWDNGVALPEQIFRCYPTADRAPARVRSDGQTVEPQWRIIGLLGLDMEVGDQFDNYGHLLEVVFVREDQYAVRAEAFEAAGIDAP